MPTMPLPLLSRDAWRKILKVRSLQAPPQSSSSTERDQLKIASEEDGPPTNSDDRRDRMSARRQFLTYKPISHEALAAARVRPIEPLRWALTGRMRALAPTTAMRGRGLIQEQFRSGE